MINQNDRYQDENCMDFTNEELIKYLVAPLREIKGVSLLYLSDGDVVKEDTDKPIEAVCFDGNQQELCISFFGIQTSLFIKDVEIMFIDEKYKNTYTNEDISGGGVYEGNLRHLTHEEMLKLFGEMIQCFVGAKTVDLSPQALPIEGLYPNYGGYKPKCYSFTAKKSQRPQNQKSFENIVVNY